MSQFGREATPSLQAAERRWQEPCFHATSCQGHSGADHRGKWKADRQATSSEEGRLQ